MAMLMIYNVCSVFCFKLLVITFLCAIGGKQNMFTFFKYNNGIGYNDAFTTISALQSSRSGQQPESTGAGLSFVFVLIRMRKQPRPR